ncbi:MULTISPECIES: aldo/keto reductase [Actinoalloteichus]|uniref:Oxidoreductase, aryl-alcohol dehydrogenase like protein n=1 Tax=Actinoalloteichus fjordicus TaxID=1612552 RepID=A0AAC9LF45_9PSEU|nr:MULTISPECIES: aldo/keto reductase [Actinoalloteichus]APU15160.1 putative oxidoreductase, aryl-alcohol dehydrogenase like protein [Actinoalloteichus fjordicus]APU21229.1 putative oxidoreductase, aryl-alcohol dehydrogenase like protein [Actinoalloteichus sp. GBA129-24]
MDFRALGVSGPLVSEVGLGCNNFGTKIDAGQAAAVVGTALDLGINHFDTAEVYGGGTSEEYLGAALGARRDDAVIATKYRWREPADTYRSGELSAWITDAAERSLRRLGTDRIDVYYQHAPDPQAPVEEMLEAFQALFAAGKVLHFALANVDAARIDATVAAAAHHDGFPLRGVQMEWNLLAREVEEQVVPAARRAGLGVVPYFPLASGLLTGKYNGRDDLPEGSRLAVVPGFAQLASAENLARVDRLLDVAARHRRSVIELAIGWLLAQPDVPSVIAGATTPEQVEVNAASRGWIPGAAELEEIDKVLSD